MMIRFCLQQCNVQAVLKFLCNQNFKNELTSISKNWIITRHFGTILVMFLLMTMMMMIMTTMIMMLMMMMMMMMMIMMVMIDDDC